MSRPPRFFCPASLTAGAQIELPPRVARHVQVLRLQPGSSVTLFDGRGGEHLATITQMGRTEVQAQLGAFLNVEREPGRTLHLVLGMPANDRMDWLVEKATELGAASITPVLSERSVLRLSGDRADKRQAHWQAIAVAAAEQCGRNRVPRIASLQSLRAWLERFQTEAPADALKLVLSLGPRALPIAQLDNGASEVLLLSGPEGGLAVAEETLSLDHGFLPATLGPRVLRADTAPLAALVVLSHESKV